MKNLLHLILLVALVSMKSGIADVDNDTLSGYGDFNWKKGDSWACSVFVYSQYLGRKASLDRSQFVPTIKQQYELKVEVESFDTINSIPCFKIDIIPSITHHSMIDTCTKWLSIADGCLQRYESNVSGTYWQIINGCSMLDFSTTFMPISIQPWCSIERNSEVNKRLIPEVWDSIRQSRKIACDSALSFKKIDTDSFKIENKWISAECDTIDRTVQIWSKKIGWWKLYEKYDHGRIWVRAKLVSKNGVRVE